MQHLSMVNLNKGSPPKKCHLLLLGWLFSQKTIQDEFLPIQSGSRDGDYGAFPRGISCRSAYQRHQWSIHQQLCRTSYTLWLAVIWTPLKTEFDWDVCTCPRFLPRKNSWKNLGLCLWLPPTIEFHDHLKLWTHPVHIELRSLFFGWQRANDLGSAAIDCGVCSQWLHGATGRSETHAVSQWPIYRWFTYWKWWFSMAMLNNQMVHLVGGFNLPLWKMMEWKSVGMMTFPTEWKKCSKPPTSFGERKRMDPTSGWWWLNHLEKYEFVNGKDSGRMTSHIWNGK